MTVKELKEMISKYDDNTTLVFIENAIDRDGFPYDVKTDVYKVVSANAKRVRKQYGITRYED